MKLAEIGRHRAIRRRHLFERSGITVAILVAAALAVLPSATSASATPKHGGTLNFIYVASQWPNLDPALNAQDIADAPYMDAIYGDLFQEGPKGAIIDDQASGYKFLDHNMALQITLRHNIVFSDGTPFNAQAVASSIARDVLPANSCICAPNFPIASIATQGQYTVILHLSKLWSPIVSAFIEEAPNWTVDPTALANMGQSAYGQLPVAAGPYKVASNVASASMDLVKNPRYFIKSEPYINAIDISNTSSDTTAYLSMQAGSTQFSYSVSTIPLIQSARSNPAVKVYTRPALQSGFIAINEDAPPFTNILAREALYYATDVKTLNQELNDNLYKLTQSPSASAQAFYDPTVPGYKTYNLAKAQALVQQVGGISTTLATINNSPSQITLIQAIATMWEAAGIKVTIQDNSLQQTLAELTDKNWQTHYGQWGFYDNGISLPTYFYSTFMYSGTYDGTLDGLINQGDAFVNTGTRAKIYRKVAARMSQQAETIFLWGVTTFSIVDSSVKGYSNADPQLYFEKLYFS